MSLELPTIWTVEFRDRTFLEIAHEDKEEARILAKAQRIQEGKNYEVRCMYKLTRR